MDTFQEFCSKNNSPSSTKEVPGAENLEESHNTRKLDPVARKKPQLTLLGDLAPTPQERDFALALITQIQDALKGQ
jgi:hypothetical protein